MLTVDIDSNSGFCAGVIRAIGNAEEFLASNFHFYRCEGEGDERLLTFMYALDGQMLGVNVGWNVYQDCSGILERNPQVKPEDGFARVDAEWLSSVLA